MISERLRLTLLAMLCLLPLWGAETLADPISVEVRFAGADKTPLAGTLMLPVVAARGHRVPAFLLIQGSGPTDRDGNQPPGLITDLEKQLADALARIGVASLRYDKRGLHANTAAMLAAMLMAPEQQAEFARWENFVGDAAAGWRFLAAHPAIDPARVGVLGHSEGGLLALEIAAGAAPEHRVTPAALVLASTPGRPLAALLREQLERLGRRQGAPEELLRQLLDRNDQILAHIRETGQVPPDVPPPLKALYPPYLRFFWQSLAAVNPTELVMRYEGPVLVISGAEDTQVSAERDAQALGEALSRRHVANHALVIVPSASHVLKLTQGPDDPAFAGPVAPVVLRNLESWLEAQGWTMAQR